MCSQMDELDKLYGTVRYMSFKPNEVCRCFPDGYKERFSCVNASWMYSLLDSKTDTRLWMRSTMPILSYYVTPLASLDWSEACSFLQADELIAQTDLGEGGNGTFILSRQEDTDLLRARCGLSARVMVSRFERDAIHLSQQLLVTAEMPIVFPGSVQNMLFYDGQTLYDGGSFKDSEMEAIGKLDISALMSEYSTRIGDQLKRIGYRGVADVDYIYTQDTLRFMEINPRFCSSSGILSRNLARRGIPDLYQLNYMAFYGLGECKMSWSDISKKVARIEIDDSFSYVAYDSEESMQRALAMPEAWVDGLDAHYGYYEPSTVLAIESTDSFFTDR